MLAALTALLLCQLIGEATVRLLEIPVPGPVLGLVLLLALLALRRCSPCGAACRRPWRAPPAAC